MTPNVLHAEVDTVQVAIVVLAVIFSFLKWLWEQWTGNKSQTPDYGEEVDPNAERLRELQEEARRRAAAPSQPPPIPSSPPPVPAAPWEEIRKAWKDVREVAQAQKQKPTPAVSAAQKRQLESRKPVVPSPPPVLAPAPVVTAPTSPAFVQKGIESPMMASLRSLRHDPAAMRRAIVLGEVLGPPKALS